jgi:uncharacterized protein (TIGR02757 family)
MKLKKSELKEYLDEKVKLYNHPAFIEHDPICIPHRYSKKEDIEIAAFLTATLAWGQRKTIINKAAELMRLMEDKPFAFVSDAGEAEFRILSGFCHRTFSGADTVFFVKSLQYVVLKFGSLHGLIKELYMRYPDVKDLLVHFRRIFLELPHLHRHEKHISDVSKGAAAKRLNLFMRWMVRKDPIDFGLWKEIPASALYIPLDVHSGRAARNLGLLRRKVNDWQAVDELTRMLRTFDPHDPVKYDFALFGPGVAGEY